MHDLFKHKNLNYKNGPHLMLTVSYSQYDPKLSVLSTENFIAHSFYSHIFIGFFYDV